MFPEFFNVMPGETSSPRPASAGGSANKAYVLSVGGSLFVREKIDTDFVKALCASIDKLSQEGYKFALVVGGGTTARSYVEAGRELGASNYVLDELGIAITRANATLVAAHLPASHNAVARSIPEAHQWFEAGRTPVLGGLLPGFTTDAVAALLAEALSATFVNLSTTEGLLDSDPKLNPSAKLVKEMSFERLFLLAASHNARPGQSFILDLPASVVLKRSKIPAIFVHGHHLDQFENAVRGFEFTGTLVNKSEPGLETEIDDLGTI